MQKPLAPVVSPSVFLSFIAALVCVLGSAGPARAQIYEAVGTRAQGMGGAFVAVADDASATWWNPAGLGSGTAFSAIIERASHDDPGTPANTGPARRDTSTSFAMMMPAFAVSYYRFRVGEVTPSSGAIAGGNLGRQDEGAAGVDLHSLAYQKFGVTIGQSFTSHLVIASTFGLLRGGTGASSEGASADAVDHATNLDVDGETHGDIDLGALVKAGELRLGVTVKHMTRPVFGSGASAVLLDRQGRAGIALETHAGSAPLTLSGDVDLSKTPTVNGDVQHVAGGAELWLGNRKVGLRGGVSANLVDEARPAASSGLSLALKSSLYVDGAMTFGSDTTRSGWGVSIRATF